jgi:hypothetical protein
VLQILLIKGQSQYGGTRLFADEAAAAFDRAGHTAEVMDVVGNATYQADLAALAASGRFGLVMSFNALGDYRHPDGRSMAELFGCPHVVWHTDYVLTSWDRLKATPPSTTLLVVDPTQIDALNAAAGEGRHRARFFPHPAVGEAVEDEPDVEAFIAARPIPVLWSGGFVEPQRPWSSAGPTTQKVMDSAVELALADEWMPPHLALAQVLKAIGHDVSDPARRRLLSSACLIDGEVRAIRRQAFLLALAESGVELHICGGGWEPHLHRFRSATWHGVVEMTRMVELMRQSRLVLNTNGNFGAGSHERPFTASLAGAATFSDYSRYYAAEFKPGVDIELFSWLDLPGAMDRLRALSADPERCWRMARAAKQLSLAGHTWERRIPDILEAAGLSAAG